MLGRCRQLRALAGAIVMLYARTVNLGYYTAEWTGHSLPAPRRVELEVEFAREFEALLGGSEAATALCLAASEGQALALDAIKEAATASEHRLRAANKMPEGRFSIRAWAAMQL